MSDKRALTFNEVVTAAYLRFVRNVPVTDIATAYDVNSGRVSEATQAVAHAIRNLDDTYKASVQAKADAS
jgi:hypothetical protein